MFLDLKKVVCDGVCALVWHVYVCERKTAEISAVSSTNCLFRDVFQEYNSMQVQTHSVCECVCE